MPRSPRTPHARFYETLRQICDYPTGGQGRPPLQGCGAILPVVRTNFQLPTAGSMWASTPTAIVIDCTDSHWCIPICRCVPHNPFVTASPCHLPLHKGGLVQCKRGGAVETCKKRAGQALPLRYDKSFTSSSLGSRLRSRTPRGSLFRAG